MNTDIVESRRCDSRSLLAGCLALLVAACGAASGTDRIEVDAGTTLTANLDQELSTATASKGDAVSATVTAPVTGEDGAVLIPSGARLQGEVTGVRDEGSREKPAYLAVQFDQLEVRGSTVSIDSSEVVEVNPAIESETHDEAAKIGGGAAAGAILGGLITGEAEGAVAGGIVGAAAGTAITLGTAHQHAYLPRGSRVRVELKHTLAVPAPSEETGGQTAQSGEGSG